jgi:PIN like domain
VGVREQFAAYYPPDPERRREFVAAGLVALDANVLLDLYRMNTDAREDVLGLLRQLSDRLWVPHQAALEFHRNRFAVIHDQEQVFKKLQKDVTDAGEKIMGIVSNVRNHPIIDRKALEGVIRESLGVMRSYLEGLGQEPILSIQTAVDADPVLDAVTTLLADKVGSAYTPDEMTKVEAEGMQRVKDQRPPGYADAKKDGAQALGDYVLWRQLLDEAVKRKLPVLLVTNDQKEDWYRRLHGITIGPRTELISEMLEEAGVPFHAQTLERFLGSAAPILRSVKETTVTEVRRIAEADRTAQGDAKAASRNAADPPTGGVNLAAFTQDQQERLRLENRQRELARRAHELQAMLDKETEAASPDKDDPRSYRRTLLARLKEIRADQVQIENILQQIGS